MSDLKLRKTISEKNTDLGLTDTDEPFSVVEKIIGETLRKGHSGIRVLRLTIT